MNKHKSSPNGSQSLSSQYSLHSITSSPILTQMSDHIKSSENSPNPSPVSTKRTRNRPAHRRVEIESPHGQELRRPLSFYTSKLVLPSAKPISLQYIRPTTSVESAAANRSIGSVVGTTGATFRSNIEMKTVEAWTLHVPPKQRRANYRTSASMKIKEHP